MRKLSPILLLLSLLWLSPAPAQGPVVGPGQALLCGKIAQAAPVTATTTALVSGVAGQTIYICGWHVTSTQSTSSTFQLEYGTQGGPCTSPTTITPAFNVTSTAPSADHIDYASIQLAQGSQLCVVSTGGTVGLAVMVYYVQF